MEQNKMSYVKINNLIWKMGIPMILSMVLQAIYNVVDTIFVINSNAATLGNEALTAAFPIQILIIAIGVGTGVGINAMLSKSLGENNHKLVSKVAGNGIFLALVIYLIFLLFGIFGVRPYMNLMSDNQEVIDYGVIYLRICCCLSLGSIGYTVYERFLQATGKTASSMVSQMSGALANIILDAIFILVFNWGVAGAAWATIIGQFISLFVAMILHYKTNKEIKNNLSDMKPSTKVIGAIYKIGLPAAIMQALLAVMMFIVILIINTISNDVTRTLMVNSYGIYYKIMQIGLFACFGLSNTLITITSFNYGMKNEKRVKDTVKYGIINSIIVALIITALFQVLAKPISSLFGLSLEEISSTGIKKEDVISTCTIAMHIATIGYIFMGVSVGIQGILQGFRNVYKPVIISLLRLIVFVVPFAILFTKTDNVTTSFWWTFPIAELLTLIISAFLLKDSIKKLDFKNQRSLYHVITISRTHGSRGKAIAKALACKLGYTYYDKENYYDKKMNEEEIELLQSKEINEIMVNTQAEQIKKIASLENTVICGRCANYILRNMNVISIFIDAPMDYRINQIMIMYKDTKEEAKANIIKSDIARKQYYESITGWKFGDESKYSMSIDSSQGIDEMVNIIIEKIKGNN